ncbi:MAG: DUF488 family protein [Puniceicoccales bacterium]|jgi:uncharacterized protein YeaO (DUF488 family)|nr:DUF488 family protein [Puniceicoccales bacterium]
MKSHLKIKRIYADYSSSDGYWVLVDRLWPRGISKEKARLDEWNKDIAPSQETRKHFNHEDDKWEWFQKTYLKELKSNTTFVLEFLDRIKNKKQVTLLYGAKNPDHNQTVVLREFLERKMDKLQ